MTYIVSQLRKNGNTIYMNDIEVSPSTITSPNTFGGSTSFTDFALAGNFSVNEVYYLRFQIHKIPQYFYSGSKTSDQVAAYADSADILNLQIILKNDTDDEEQDPPEIIGTCTVPQALYNQPESYSSYSFVFSPSKNFNRLGFRISRVSYDAIYATSQPRNWLIESETDITKMCYTGNGNKQVTVSTQGDRIIYSGQNGDVCTLNNLVEQSSGWIKFGYQCRPGSLIVVNREPIRVGRSGIYEINNGTTINSFMIANPNGSNNSNIDAFLLDYAYQE